MIDKIFLWIITFSQFVFKAKFDKQWMTCYNN